MTDPGLADRTYVEPITVPSSSSRSSRRSAPTRSCPRWAARPGSTRPSSSRRGRRPGQVRRGDDWLRPRGHRARRGPRSSSTSVMAEARRRDPPRSGYRLFHRRRRRHRRPKLGYPAGAAPRASRMGGAGAGIAHDAAELHAHRRRRASSCSPAGEVLVEEGIEGWKEYEIELMRDRAGNGVVVCSDRELRRRSACTPATPSPWRPLQTLTDARVPAHAARRRHRHPPRRSAWTPAAPTCSSPSTRKPAA